MNTVTCTRPLASTCRTPGLRRRAAVAAFARAAVPMGVRADIESFTVSPADVASGGTSTGNVKVALSSRLYDVALESSNAALVSVPARVRVTDTDTSFPITTAAGQAGCSTLSAKQEKSTAVRHAVLFVAPAPASTVRLVLSMPSVAGSQTLIGTVSVLLPPGSGGAVQSVTLASSNPSVTVPASATLAPGIDAPLQAKFGVTASAVGATGCSVISATFNGVTHRALLKLFRANN